MSAEVYLPLAWSQPCHSNDCMSSSPLCFLPATGGQAWHKPRRVVLALGVQGLMRKRRLTLTAVARGMESRCRIIHRVKRLWRFLKNEEVDPRDAAGALARQAFELRSSGWVPVVMDETGLKDRATLLVAAVPYHGRALPLAIYAYAPKLLKKSLWALREGLLSVIRDALPPQDRSRLLLIGGRGYAASHFFRRLLDAHVAFVIRAPRRVLVHMACASHSLEMLVADLEPGQWRFLRQVYYGPLRARLNVVLWWQADQPEPWILATTLQSAKEARNYYRQRMGIEVYPPLAGVVQGPQRKLRARSLPTGDAQPHHPRLPVCLTCAVDARAAGALLRSVGALHHRSRRAVVCFACPGVAGLATIATTHPPRAGKK